MDLRWLRTIIPLAEVDERIDAVKEGKLSEEEQVLLNFYEKVKDRLDEEGVPDSPLATPPEE